MKRGLLITLLMMAVVAMALPASATAPTIDPLPTIIIGDADETTGTTKYLSRYLNALNLLRYIDYNVNGYPLSENKFQVWYTKGASDPSVEASNTSQFLAPLNTTGTVNLAAGAAPGSGNGDQITAPGFYWLTVMNTALVSTRPTDAYSATQAAHGWDKATSPTYPATEAGWTAPTDLWLYAANVPSFPTTPSLISTASLTVWTVAGENDSFSATPKAWTEVYEKDFTGGTGGWFFYSPVGGGIYACTPYSVGGIGARLDTNPLPSGGIAYYGTWYMSTDGVNAAFPIAFDSSVIYRFRAQLKCTAASALASPGYRLEYVNNLFNHQGDLLMFTFSTDGDTVYAPFSGNDIDASVVWEAPAEMSQYGAGQILSNFSSINASYGDVRKYSVQFSPVDVETADAGDLLMTAMAIETHVKPAAITPTLHWGTGGTAFNDVSNGWYLGTADLYGINLGVGSTTAAQLSMGAGNTNAPASLGLPAGAKSGYINAAPNPLLGSVGVSSFNLTKNTLMRLTFTARSENVNTSPNMRVGLFGFNPSTWGLRSMRANNTFQGGFSKSMMDAAGGPTKGDAPGVPKATGSTAAIYFYTHNAANTAVTRVLPLLDVYNISYFTNYPQPTGNVVFTDVKVEVLPWD